jgi:hypothetical protein
MHTLVRITPTETDTQVPQPCSIARAPFTFSFTTLPSALKPAYIPASTSRHMSTFVPSLQPAAGSRSGISV